MSDTVDKRLGQQPSTRDGVLYNIDPKTGKLLDSTYDVRSGGGLVRVDSEGNPIFVGTTNNFPVHESLTAFTIATDKTNFNPDDLSRIYDTRINQLSTTVDSTAPSDVYRSLCNIFSDIISDIDDRTGGGGSGGAGGGGGGGGGAGGINVGGGNILGDGSFTGAQSGTHQDLLELVDVLQDRLDRTLISNREVLDLRIERDNLLAELAECANRMDDLLDLVNALKSCKERLELALNRKNAVIEALARDLEYSEEVNNQLLGKIKEQEINIQRLIEKIAEFDIRIADSLRDFGIGDINININQDGQQTQPPITTAPLDNTNPITNLPLDTSGFNQPTANDPLGRNSSGDGPGGIFDPGDNNTTDLGSPNLTGADAVVAKATLDNIRRAIATFKGMMLPEIFTSDRYRLLQDEFSNIETATVLYDIFNGLVEILILLNDPILGTGINDFTPFSQIMDQLSMLLDQKGARIIPTAVFEIQSRG